MVRRNWFLRGHGFSHHHTVPKPLKVIVTCFLRLSLLLVLLVLAGCARTHIFVTPIPPTPMEVNLPFETIEQSDYSEFYHLHPLAPQQLLLITSAEQAARLKGMVSPEAQQKLAQLDYGRYFVTALFRGDFGSSGYDVIIQRVARRDGRLVVYAQFWAPSPYYEVTAAESQPHHVVQVLRDGGPLQEAELQLVSQAVTPTPPH